MPLSWQHLELKLLIPSEFFRTADRKTGHVDTDVLQLLLSPSPQYINFLQVAFFQGKIYFSGELLICSEHHGQRGHSVTLAVPLPGPCCGPLSHQHPFMGIQLMREQGHPNGSNASRRERLGHRDTGCASAQSMEGLGCGFSAWLGMLLTE